MLQAYKAQLTSPSSSMQGVIAFGGSLCSHLRRRVDLSRHVHTRSLSVETLVLAAFQYQCWEFHSTGISKSNQHFKGNCEASICSSAQRHQCGYNCTRLRLQPCDHAVETAAGRLISHLVLGIYLRSGCFWLLSAKTVCCAQHARPGAISGGVHGDHEDEPGILAPPSSS